MPNIAVIGDRDPRYVAQESIADAVEHSSKALGITSEVTWIATDALDDDGAASTLDGVDAVWCAPGSPYRSLDGALAAIRVARTSGRPFLGTCAGFQHGVLEIARDLLGVDARHTEYGDPGSGTVFIEQLTCSPFGQTLRVAIIDPVTRAIVGADEVDEEYRCNYGLDEARVLELAAGGVVVCGLDVADGSTRILRLDRHPFFYLTLFVPQTRSTPDAPHPLITAFVEAAAR